MSGAEPNLTSKTVRQLRPRQPGWSTVWRDAWGPAEAPNWLALTALAVEVTPELIELAAVTADVRLTPKECEALARRFVATGLADLPDAEGMPATHTAPRLRAEVRQSMLGELEAGDGSPVARRQALLKAGLDRSDSRLGAQLAIWAAESREWAALESVWLNNDPAAVLLCPEVVAAFHDAPRDQRKRLPGLSVAYGIVQALDPVTGDFDIDLLVQTFVNEGHELHAGWNRHTRVDGAVLAGILWMLAQGSVAGSLTDPGLGGAWDTHLAVEQLIADRTRQGDAPSTRTLVAFHSLSCGIAVLRSDWGQAASHAELGTTLSRRGDIFGLVAQAAWATIGLVTGNSAEFRRAIVTVPEEMLASEAVQDLLGMAGLVQANLELDRHAAEKVLNGRDLMSSWLRWFNYQPMFLANRAQAAILWGDPAGALAEFDSSLPGGSVASAGSYWGPVLQRTRAELLLNVGSPNRAEAVVAALLGSADRRHGLVPAARLQLMLGEHEHVLALADEGAHSIDVPLTDRAQLQAIKTAATLESGAAEGTVQEQLTSACLMCRDAGSALGFALLPHDLRSTLIDMHRLHAAGGTCILADVAARGGFDGLRENGKGARSKTVVKLTPREEVLLPLLLTPLTIQEVADRLFVSVNTVRKQVVTLRQKLGAQNRAALIARAAELGIGTRSW